jgi:cytochrome c peroxidase
MKITGLIICLLSATASWVVAAEQPSVKRGGELFISPQLGTNGKSCSSCHSGGKGLEASAGYKEEELAGIVNQCISKPLAGKPLAADSSDLKSLVMYIKSLAAPVKP